jgi:CheY-like chemotaxis protein
MFKIKDSGIGISSELRGRLFTPYTQADKSTTRKFGGTGLGLSICKQLVAMMGGEIGVDSRSGQGSCFWFSIELDVLEEKQNELLASRSELKEKAVALILSESASQQLIADHLIEWGMLVDCIEQSVLPADLDYAAYDILLVGSSVRPSLEAWLEHAGRNKTPTLLLNPINDTSFQGDVFQTEYIKYLKMPASLTQLQYSLLELLGLTVDSGDHHRQDDVPVSVSGVADLAILVAEDNMVNLKVIQALLKSLDVTAEFVLDGLAAVEHYCSSPESYDVILMDCEMPNMDGFEASKQIRAFEEQLQIRRVTICALTAHAMDDITDRCYEAGMDEVLIKPVDLNVLTRKLQEYARQLAHSELP